VGGSGDYAVGASVTFNLFDAGRRIDQAHAAQSLANAHQEQLANQIRGCTAISTFPRVSEWRCCSVSAQATELYGYSGSLRAGVTTITELLRAETALVRARIT
jgi:outer membrane protein TolC